MGISRDSLLTKTMMEFATLLCVGIFTGAALGWFVTKQLSWFTLAAIMTTLLFTYSNSKIILPDLVSCTYSELGYYMITTAMAMPVAFTLPMVLSQGWIAKQAWWSQAHKPTVSLLENFGHPKGSVTEEIAVGGFSYIMAQAVHHTLCALLMLPVVLNGWKDRADQNLFLAGALLWAGSDVYDSLVNAIKTFTRFGTIFHDTVPFVPLVTTILFQMHHSWSMLVVLPFTVHMPDDEEYHLVAFSLLAASGICYGFGQYKLTLDMTQFYQLMQLKAIVVVQFVAIIYTRVIIWFPCSYRLMQRATAKAPEHPELYGTYVAVVGMSLFNMLLVMDSTGGLFKWLPQTTDGKLEKKESWRAKT